jgi:hypothetical protein
LFLLPLSLLGCAAQTSSPPPPPPPLVQPLRPHEGAVQVKLYHWKIGDDFVYNVHRHQHTYMGSAGKTSEAKVVMRMKAVDRTAQGFTRVELSVDGQPVGVLSVDDAGALRDATSKDPKLRELLAALVRRTAQGDSECLGPFRPGERRVTTLVEVPGAAEELPGTAPTAECWIAGFYTVQGRDAIGVETQQANLFPTSKWLTADTYVDRGSSERITYYDVDEGFMIASYLRYKMEGQCHGRRLETVLVQSIVLDLDATRGLRR